MTTRNDVIKTLVGSQFTDSTGYGLIVRLGDLPALAADLLATMTDDGVVEPPATPRAVPNPAAQADRASWRPAPSSPLSDGEVASPPADTGGRSTPAAESANVKAASPSVLPRPFLLVRLRDVTGQTGTGVIAWGTEWPDKTASLRWATEYPSTVHWDSVDAIIAVHGHGGATVLRYLEVSP